MRNVFRAIRMSSVDLRITPPSCLSLPDGYAYVDRVCSIGLYHYYATKYGNGENPKRVSRAQKPEPLQCATIAAGWGR